MRPWSSLPHQPGDLGGLLDQLGMMFRQHDVLRHGEDAVPPLNEGLDIPAFLQKRFHTGDHLLILMDPKSREAHVTIGDETILEPLGETERQGA